MTDPRVTSIRVVGLMGTVSYRMDCPCTRNIRCMYRIGPLVKPRNGCITIRSSGQNPMSSPPPPIRTIIYHHHRNSVSYNYQQMHWKTMGLRSPRKYNKWSKKISCDAVRTNQHHHHRTWPIWMSLPCVHWNVFRMGEPEPMRPILVHGNFANTTMMIWYHR